MRVQQSKDDRKSTYDALNLASARANKAQDLLK